ncbi:MAG: hypothetical protein SH850_21715 [Planctomycetaceae bacterium]|nr:hypothetical protein [Planctomycetaceae bacterium]
MTNDKKAKKPPKRDEPFSLYPMTMEQALRFALQSPPMPKKAPAKKKPAQ